MALGHERRQRCSFAINESTVYRRAYEESDPHCLTGFELELESTFNRREQSSAMIGEQDFAADFWEICVEMQT